MDKQSNRQMLLGEYDIALVSKEAHNQTIQTILLSCLRFVASIDI